MGNHLSGTSMGEVATFSHGYREPRDVSRMTERICTGEVEEAKIIHIRVSSFLKLAILHQSLNDTILSRRRDLSGSSRRGLMSTEFGSKVLSRYSSFLIKNPEKPHMRLEA